MSFFDFICYVYLSLVIKETKFKNDSINNIKKGLLSVWKYNEADKDIEENQVCLLKSLQRSKYIEILIMRTKWNDNCNLLVKTTYLRYVPFFNEYDLYIISH